MENERVAAWPGVPPRQAARARVVWEESRARESGFLTNVQHLAASGVAGIYEDNWQIELFFNELKEQLKVKAFAGTREGTVQFQGWTTLITLFLRRLPERPTQESGNE